MGDLIGAGKLELTQSKAWKEKLEGAQALLAAVQNSSGLDAHTVMAVFTFVHAATRQWKESNFQVVGAYIEALDAAASATSGSCPDRAVDMAVQPLTEKLADVKVSAAEATQRPRQRGGRGAIWVCCVYLSNSVLF